MKFSTCAAFLIAFLLDITTQSPLEYPPDVIPAGTLPRNDTDISLAWQNELKRRQAACANPNIPALKQAETLYESQAAKYGNQPGYEYELKKRQVISAGAFLWSCSNGPLPNINNAPPFGNEQQYEKSEAVDTKNFAFNLVQRGQIYYTPAGTPYPHQYHGRERIQLLIDNCGDPNWIVMFEYPLFANDDWWVGGRSPGADRVIFDICGRLCGVITHRGLSQNAFHDCSIYTI